MEGSYVVSSVDFSGDSPRRVWYLAVDVPVVYGGRLIGRRGQFVEGPFPTRELAEVAR